MSRIGLAAFLLNSVLIPAHALDIGNRTVRYAISERTGAIDGGWSVETGEKLFGCSSDEYVLEYGDFEVKSSERDDRAVTVRKEQSDTSTVVTVTCANPILGEIDVRLAKRYELDDTGTRLSKTTTVINDGHQGLFLSLFTVTDLGADFRAQGTYHVPYCLRTPASRIAVATSVNSVPPYPPSWHDLLFCSLFSDGWGAAGFVYKVNGRYSIWNGYHSSKGTSLMYTPAGWRYRAVLDFLEPGGSSSVEVIYTVVHGDMSTLQRQYFSLPAIQELRRYETPNWIGRTKAVVWINHFTPAGVSDQAIQKWKDVCSDLGDGYLMMFFNNVTSGGWEGDYRIVEKKERDWIKERINALRESCPNIKLGFYSLLAGIGEPTRTYREHPGWAMRLKDGSMLDTHGAGWDLQAGLPELRDYFASQFADFVSMYAPDFLYFDLYTLVYRRDDYANRMSSQYWDWYLLHKGIIDSAREVKNDIGICFNGANGAPADCTFMETSFAPPGCDWRVLAEVFYLGKLGQKAEDNWLTNLGYSESSARVIWNYNLALALKPAINPFVERMDFQPGNTDYEFLQISIPYIEAAWEIRNALLVECDISPWWESDETQVEAYCLRQGTGWIVSAINHAATVVRSTISVNSDKMGLREDRPVFIWTEEIEDISTLTRSTPQVVKHADFRTLQSRGGRIQMPVTLQPDLVKMMTVSDVPAWVYSVNGRPAQFRVPDNVDVQISGDVDDDGQEVVLDIRSFEDEAEIAVYFPFRDDPRVLFDGRDIAARTYEACNHRFRVIKIPEGDHRVRLTNEKPQLAAPVEPAAPAARPADGVSPPAEVSDPSIVTLRNANIEFALPEGIGHYQGAGYRQIAETEFDYLHLFLPWFHYNDGQARKAGVHMMRWSGTSYENLEVVRPTRRIDDNTAMARLQTEDGRLTIEVTTKIGGTSVRQEYSISNSGDRPLRNVEFRPFLYFAVPDPTVAENEVNLEDNVIYVHNPESGRHVGLWSDREFDSYCLGIGTYGYPWAYLALPTVCLKKNTENRFHTGTCAVCWRVSDLSPGETSVISVVLGIADSYEGLAMAITDPDQRRRRTTPAE